MKEQDTNKTQHATSKNKKRGACKAEHLDSTVDHELLVRTHLLRARSQRIKAQKARNCRTYVRN